MIDLLNILLSVLSVLVIPIVILIVRMIIEISILKSEVLNLTSFDKKIDEKLDKIYDLLIGKK